MPGGRFTLPLAPPGTPDLAQVAPPMITVLLYFPNARPSKNLEKTNWLFMVFALLRGDTPRPGCGLWPLTSQDRPQDSPDRPQGLQNPRPAPQYRHPKLPKSTPKPPTSTPRFPKSTPGPSKNNVPGFRIRLRSHIQPQSKKHDTRIKEPSTRNQDQGPKHMPLFGLAGLAKRLQFI